MLVSTVLTALLLTLLFAMLIFSKSLWQFISTLIILVSIWSILLIVWGADETPLPQEQSPPAVNSGNKKAKA